MHKCSNCGFVLVPGSKKCTRCGIDIDNNEKENKKEVTSNTSLNDDLLIKRKKKSTKKAQILLLENNTNSNNDVLNTDILPVTTNNDIAVVDDVLLGRKKKKNRKPNLLLDTPQDIHTEVELNPENNSDIVSTPQESETSKENKLKSILPIIPDILKKEKTAEEIEKDKIEEEQRIEEEKKRKELISSYEYDDDEVIYGDNTTLKQIQDKEKERELLSKPHKKNMFQSLIESSISKDKENNNRGLLSNMISGFADEKEDENIKSQISKGKKLESAASSLLGKKRKTTLEKDVRQDIVEQNDQQEEDYDNYYEVVIPADNLKYENKSSFKMHFIGLAVIFLISVAVVYFVATSGLGKILK